MPYQETCGYCQGTGSYICGDCQGDERWVAECYCDNGMIHGCEHCWTPDADTDADTSDAPK